MRRDLLRELAQLVRNVEPDGTNIGPFVAEHACELALTLHAEPHELVGASTERDGPLAGRLRARLELASERDRRLRRERACRAAMTIARTARSFELGVVLDVDIVLGDLLADSRTKYISFAAIDGTVIVRAAMLRRARYLRHIHVDIACFISERGLALCWKAGAGRLNFYASEPRVRDERDIIVVHLPVAIAPSVQADATSA